MTNDSVSISLTPDKATLGFAHELSAKHPRSIQMTCKLGRDERVVSPQFGVLNGAKWSAYIVDSDTYNANATNQQAIGLLVYRAEGGGLGECALSVSLRPELFETLLSSIFSGSNPGTITVELVGLEWEPAGLGGGVVWDVVAKRVCPITNVRFEIPLQLKA
jgi:hypothetical protein